MPCPGGRAYGLTHRDPRRGDRQEGVSRQCSIRTSSGPETFSSSSPSTAGACLVAGCPCKDARIVSHRRAAFFAAVARQAGQTADRVIVAEPSWRIPLLEGAQS